MWKDFNLRDFKCFFKNIFLEYVENKQNCVVVCRSCKWTHSFTSPPFLCCLSSLSSVLLFTSFTCFTSIQSLLHFVHTSFLFSSAFSLSCSSLPCPPSPPCVLRVRQFIEMVNGTDSEVRCLGGRSPKSQDSYPGSPRPFSSPSHKASSSQPYLPGTVQLCSACSHLDQNTLVFLFTRAMLSHELKWSLFKQHSNIIQSTLSFKRSWI